MSRKEFHLLLQRYLNKESTKEETELIEQWYELLDDDSVSPVDEAEVREIEARIWDKLQSQQQVPAVVVPFYKKSFFRWSAAACIILLAGLAIWNLNNRDRAEALYTSLDRKEYAERSNNTTQAISVLLADGSTVQLDPGAALKYPLHFEAAARKVYLKGNAFFQVSKRPQQPFYVFSNEIVTHVLGTSFYVSSKNKNEVEVSVKTGRVEVYEGETANTEPATNGVVLIPNQKAVFNREKREFQKELADQPQVLQQPDSALTLNKFVYDEAPLKSVLDALSMAYGIEIVVENDALYDCPFTGDIAQPDLYKKLDFICEATGSSYEIKGTTIIIRGKGCSE